MDGPDLNPHSLALEEVDQVGLNAILAVAEKLAVQLEPFQQLIADRFLTFEVIRFQSGANLCQ